MKEALDNIQLENLVDWSKPMFWQVGQLGKQYKTWVHLPVDRPLRLFRYDFIEFFSKTPWFVVPIVWLPLAIYLLYRGVLMSTVLHDSAGPAWYSALLRYTFLASCVGVFVLGCIGWSLIEYCLHRFVFHAEPPSESPFWISMHFVLHGQHHKVPFDPGRLVFPPVAASLFVIVLYFSLCSLLPDAVASCYTSGTLFGYVCYDLTHYYLHHGVPSNGSYFARLKQHHVQHHFAQQNRGFGISTKLWDQPFNTMIKWNCPAEEEDDEKEGHKSQ
ncbi:PREDICTED: fatty acid 2-hydroxylase-like [Priapulus caudatus]|uniref:Fatty acid 2-hydroxylase-like n=1 Tax=Priapulus caudatus TaxID=37621 RepID=A0ABM1DNY7_PRICU|nr:PREDICTED: fatty acid 2-hydroxylase-like [Priapulus caudatus]